MAEQNPVNWPRAGCPRGGLRRVAPERQGLETYHKCIELAILPSVTKARYQLAVMEKERKHADRAVVILEKRFRMSPSDIDRGNA